MPFKLHASMLHAYGPIFDARRVVRRKQAKIPGDRPGGGFSRMIKKSGTAHTPKKPQRRRAESKNIFNKRDSRVRFSE